MKWPGLAYNYRMNHHNETGLTVLELLTAVVVLSLLVAIAHPLFSKYTSRARQSEARAALSNIYAAEKSFYLAKNAYTACIGNIGYAPSSETQYYSTGFMDGFYQGPCQTPSSSCIPGGTYGLRLSFDIISRKNGFGQTVTNWARFNEGGDLCTPTTNVPGKIFFSASNYDISGTALSLTASPTSQCNLPAGAVTQNTFLASAAGKIGLEDIDFWTIDQNKGLVNLGPRNQWSPNPAQGLVGAASVCN